MSIKERERIKLFSSLKKLIPKDASVSCGETWASHLSNRKGFFPFIEARAHWDNADYLLLDLSRRTPAFDRLLSYLERFEKEGNFHKIFEETKNGNDFCIWARKGKEEEILETTRRLAKEKSDSPHTHFILSSIYYHLGMLKDAQREAEETIRLAPDYYNSEEIYTILGDISISMKDPDKAYFAYKKAASMEPLRVVDLLKVKELYLHQGFTKKADEVAGDIDRIILGLKEEAKDNSLFPKKQLANIFAQMGRYSEAVHYLKEVLIIEPRDPWAKQLFMQIKDFS
jgi:tetratricopeptide (TPR) repeat protein